MCSRTLWVSPTNSPVRLGVSPAAASTRTGVFSERFEALFSCPGILGCSIYLSLISLSSVLWFSLYLFCKSFTSQLSHKYFIFDAIVIGFFLVIFTLFIVSV